MVRKNVTSITSIGDWYIKKWKHYGKKYECEKNVSSTNWSTTPTWCLRPVRGRRRSWKCPRRIADHETNHPLIWWSLMKRPNPSRRFVGYPYCWHRARWFWPVIICNYHPPLPRTTPRYKPHCNGPCLNDWWNCIIRPTIKIIMETYNIQYHACLKCSIGWMNGLPIGRVKPCTITYYKPTPVFNTTH